MIEKVELIDIPVLKAWDKIFDLTACVAEYPYNRDGLREAVLSLYAGKTEKSVFRGMAIPTLRRLGLIIGYEQLIRLSANGSLVYEGWKTRKSLGKRALGAIIYEMDVEEIGFLRELGKKPEIQYGDFVELWSMKVNAPNPGRARERIKDWLGLLEYCDLITKSNDTISPNHKAVDRASADTDYKKKGELFKKLLFSSYERLVKGSKGIQSHPIEDLRREVALIILVRHKQIMTDKQFDELLLRFPKTGDNYLISFGRSMGADEKLFQMDGKYYQTISIRHFD